MPEDALGEELGGDEVDASGEPETETHETGEEVATTSETNVEKLTPLQERQKRFGIPIAKSAASITQRKQRFGGAKNPISKEKIEERKAKFGIVKSAAAAAANSVSSAEVLKKVSERQARFGTSAPTTGKRQTAEPNLAGLSAEEKEKRMKVWFPILSFFLCVRVYLFGCCWFRWGFLAQNKTCGP